ncbi:sn-1-specific diacylglycerol lipase ABHD11-like isoform X2 [Glandiceps talaboti]
MTIILKISSFPKSLVTIIVDARNHGESAHSNIMSYPAMSADLVALLSKLQIEKAVLLGHSMGGKVALVTALTQPELVDQLISVDIAPASSGKSTIDFPAYIRAMRNVKFDNRVTRSKMRQLADHQLQDSVPDIRDRQFLLTNLEERSGHYMWRVNLDAIEKQLKTLYSFDHFDTVYDRSTLFIGGAKSPYISDKHYPEISRLFPKSAVTHIEGAGHWVHSDKPWVFLDLVQNFLNGSLLPDYFNYKQLKTGSNQVQSPYVIDR